jgi:hypothetical protein
MMALPRRTKILAVAALGVWVIYGILWMVFPSGWMVLPSEPAHPVWVGDHYECRGRCWDHRVDRSGPGPHDDEELREFLPETSGSSDQKPYRIWRKCRDPERDLDCGPWQDGPMPEGFFDGGRD